MTWYRIEIDRDLCGGFGSCASLAPRTCSHSTPAASPRPGETPRPTTPTSDEAAAACPMAAIVRGRGRRAAA